MLGNLKSLTCYIMVRYDFEPDCILHILYSILGVQKRVCTDAHRVTKCVSESANTQQVPGRELNLFDHVID